MPYYRRYYKRRPRYYSRRPRYYRRTANGRFKAKIRKSVQQRDMFRVIVSSKPIYVTSKFIAKSTPNTGFLTEIHAFTPLTTLFGYNVTTNQEYHDKLGSYANFSKLFDQVKINAVRLKISVTSVPQPTTNAAIQIKQCLDRNGVNDIFASLLIDQQGSENIRDIEAATAEMETYSSFYSRMVNQNDLYSIYKTFIPSGLQQKGFWYGCSYKPTFETRDERLTPDLTTPWKPVFLVQFDTPSLAANGGTTLGFSYQWEYDLTFKGQRQWTDAIPAATANTVE